MMDQNETTEVELFEAERDSDTPKSQSIFGNSFAPGENRWIADLEEDSFKILDPDDPLMNRFQNALKSHLVRIDDKLSDEIRELEAAVKEANKVREDEGVVLYDIQQEAAGQETAIENYKEMLAEITNLRADIDERLKKIKQAHKKVADELDAKRKKEKMLLSSIDSLDMLQQQFSKWESSLSDNLTISQRISEKDAYTERELMYQKQQKDFVLYKLEDEVWKLQREIKDLDEQLQLKDEEKMRLGQALADANADLQGLEKEHKTLYSAWSSVLHLISQRDKINEEISSEQRKIRDSLQNLQAQVEKLKKDSQREMENNERLTELQSRINEEIVTVKKLYNGEKEKYLLLESNFVKVSKLVEQNEKEFGVVSMEYEAVNNAENALNKEVLKFDNHKRALEENVLLKLDDKVAHDKALKHLNKILHELKDSNLEFELNLNKAENLYGKSLFELETNNSLIANEKFDLETIEQNNSEKKKEIDKLLLDIKNLESLSKQKERKITEANKKIKEISGDNAKDEVSPLDAKIFAMEKNIDEVEAKIKKAQQFWLRQQGYVCSLSEQRDLQKQELGILCKETLLMDQKNLKLEAELEKQRKEEANVNKTWNLLQHRLQQINHRLSSQKDLKDELEDKNNAVRNEYIESLKDAEVDLIKSQGEIKQLTDEKCNLKEELKVAEQESLSWEKKVQLANQTNKSYKEERNTGGDIALMKSEIHKMEIRLSYLRKAQEKLVQDMEFCIFRRENIIDEAMAKEKITPKSHHNQRIVLRKRLDDQKTKIKQIVKENKQIDIKMINLEEEQKKLLDYLSEGQKLLRHNEDVIPDIEKQIAEAELIKHHNLEILVRKQRRVNTLRDLKDGQYKPLIKNELMLEEEWKNQLNINQYLSEIMKQTENDFPMLKNKLKKIILTLQM